MYQLYWCKGTASLAPMAIIEEVGIESALIEVDGARGEHRSDRYRKIHPLGLIPALRLPDGRTMFESAGIVMFLADRFPEAGLAPETGSDERAFYNQWLLYFADTLYPTYNRLYHPHRFSVEQGDARRIEERCYQLLVYQWRVVDDALKGRDWLVGDSCTAADIYMQMVSTWDKDPMGFASRCPNVSRVAAVVARRPAVARAVSKHMAVAV